VPDGSSDKRPGRDDGVSDLASAYRKAGPYLGASTSLVVSVGGCAALGYWGDTKLGHGVPWMFMVGAGVGMVVGFIGFFRAVIKAGKGK
jgi:hypothetical protein